MTDAATTGRVPSVRTNEERTQLGRTLRAPFYAVCSVLFCAIALSGLFLGYVMRGSVGALIAGGEPILHGSYLGLIVEVLRGSIPLPAADGTQLSELLPVFLYFMTYALAAGVLLSVAFTVLTFLKRSSARFFCTLNGYLVLFLYGTICVAAVLLGSIRQEIYSWRQLDLPSLTAALLAFCVFAVMAVAHRGARGALNVFLLLVNALSVCAFIFPGTPLLSDLDMVATFGVGAVKRILLAAFCIVTVADLILSVLRLERPRTQAVDILRFAVQFAAALGVAAVYLAEGGIAFFTDQPFASVFLLLPPLCALLVSVFAHTFVRKEGARAPLTPKAVAGDGADLLPPGSGAPKDEAAPPAAAAETGPTEQTEQTQQTQQTQQTEQPEQTQKTAL